MLKNIFISIFMILVLSFGNFTASAATFAGLPVEYNTRDGMIIKGTLYLPKGRKKPGKPPVVILLHSLGGNQRDWDSLPQRLVDAGMAVLALDMRGHGESIYTVKMKRKYWQNFTNETYKKFPLDVLDAIAFLRTNKKVDASKIGIVSTGLGTVAAVQAAAKEHYCVKTLVLISPVDNFKGMEILLKIVDYGHHPILSIAGGNDRISINVVNQIKKVAQGENKIVIYKGGGMSVILYKNTPAMKPEIVNWLIEKLK